LKHDYNWKALKEKEVYISYNMGLEMAVYVLEMAEELSPEGRKHLLDELKKNIGKSEESLTPQSGFDLTTYLKPDICVIIVLMSVALLASHL
jgi:hypothetical protein